MLTRAQLLMGNSSQGAVLAGQTQGVRQGVGLIIAADGTISFDSVTATGIVKTNNPTAYNAYVWPTTLGAVGQQLQLGAGGVLSWEDPDGIPWTTKGQLIVGTGAGTSTIFNVGSDGSILIADSSTASGLGYTTNFVATTSATGAANIPAGPVGSRPGSPTQGQLRFSTTSGEMEFWDGTSWQTIAGSATGLFVEKTANNGSAVLPTGTTLQRDSSPAAGFFRYNTDTTATEFFNGATWVTSSTGTVSSVSGTLPITVATGTSTPVIAINAATTALPGSVQLADAAASQGGTSATLASTPAFSVPKDASGMTGSAYIPAGTTAQRPTASNYTGQFRYNTTIPQLEYSDGAAWQAVVPPGGVVTTFSGGTTGLTPAAATSGAVTLGGTLAVANGGTGATTQAAALTNLIPSQTGNSGKVLGTDGTNASWVTGGGGGGLPTQTLVFTSSGSYTATTSEKVWVSVVGGGAGGIGLDSSTPFGPGGFNGGNGAVSWGYFNLVSGTTYNFTVGAAGVDGGVNVPGGRGGNGGSSSGFGMTVGGGQGGGDQSTGRSPNQGYSALAGSGGSLNNLSGYGQLGFISPYVPGMFGIGGSLYNDTFDSYFINHSTSGCVVILFF